MSQTIYISADNLVTYDAMKDADGNYVNDATVAFTLKDANGVAVSGATAVSMPYVSGSNGKYQGTIQETVSLTDGAQYSIEITVSGTAQDFRKLAARAQYRGEN